MYNSSLEHSSTGGSILSSPSFDKSNTIFGSLGTTLNRPYDYRFFPVYYSPRPFEGSTSPSSVGFPLTPPPTPNTQIPPLTPFYASLSKIGEFYSGSTANESQRTTSVIMKVEHQKIVELNAKDFNARTSSDSEDEIIICKWKHCYR